MSVSLLAVLALLSTGPAADAKPGALVAVGGGGTTPAILEAAMDLVSAPDVRVAVLPQASAREDAGRGSVDMWRKAGAKTAFVVPLTPPDEARASLLSGADLIWMPGGSQTRLEQALREAGLVPTLREAHAKGVVIGGTSAGAAILSEVMICGSGAARGIGPDAVEVRKGLGLWPDAIVDQHFHQRRRQARLFSAVLDHRKRIGVGIDERTAAIVRGREIEVVGKGAVMIVDARGARGSAGSWSDVRVAVLRDGCRYHLDEGLRAK